MITLVTPIIGPNSRVTSKYFSTFVRGKCFELTNSPDSSIKQVKKVYKSTISRIKKRILRNKLKALSVVKSLRAKRHLFKKSYFYRFIYRKYSGKWKRTLGLFFAPDIPHHDERDAYGVFQARFFERFKHKKAVLRIHTHPFSFGIVYITHRRRNTFITVFKADLNGTQQMVYKASVGLTGFVGPKRSTNQGKERVSSAVNAFIRYQRITTVDLVFTKSVGRWFSFTIRGLLNKRIYIRHMLIPKRHSHGYTRLKKIRRT